MRDATLILCLAAVLTLPGAAQPQSMEGRYKLTPEADCADLSSTEGILRIENGMFHGAESECRMTNGLEVRGMNATLYDMLCSGEGLTWQERAMVMRGADGGLILVWDGYAFAYPACPGPLVRPRPRPVPEEMQARD